MTIRVPTKRRFIRFTKKSHIVGRATPDDAQALEVATGVSRFKGCARAWAVTLPPVFTARFSAFRRVATRHKAY